MPIRELFRAEDETTGAEISADLGRSVRTDMDMACVSCIIAHCQNRRTADTADSIRSFPSHFPGNTPMKDRSEQSVGYSGANER